MELHERWSHGGALEGPPGLPFAPPPRAAAPAVPAAAAPARELRESLIFLAVLAALTLGGVVLRAALGATAEPVLTLGLAVSAAAAGVVVHRHSSRLDRRSGRPWRLLAVVGGLLAAGRLIDGLGAAVGDAQSAAAHVPQVLAVPLALAACLLLLPSRDGRRAGVRELLDSAIVVVAVALLAGLVLCEAVVGSRGLSGFLLAMGYPLAGALLCGIALMVVSRAAANRRRPAVWVLVAMVGASVVAVAGALAPVLGDTSADLLTGVAGAVMLAAVVRAVDTDPGHRPHGGTPAGLPMFGLVVSHVAAYGVAGVVVAVLSTGHAFCTFERIAIAMLVLCTSLRSLLWVLDGGRLTRRLQETEAYFRALAASAEDVTVVLDAGGTLRWVSGATRSRLGWTDRELTGRRLTDLLDPADHGVLTGVVTGSRRSAHPLPTTVRLRTRTGDLRYVELAGSARAGLPDSALGDGLVLHLRDVTERHVAQRELERLAYTDYLTGLPNRARFVAALEEAGARAADGERSCVLLVDLDGFKAVNDVAGHDAGDQLLAQVADQLRAGAREQDLVARLGGDEFALLVPGGPDEATGLAERLVVALDRSFRAPTLGDDGGGPLFAVSGSIGLAEVGGSGDVPAVVRQADLALRAAKAAGKRCVRSSGEAIDAAIGRRTRLARDLPTALEQGQLRVLYQPVVGVHDRRVLGLEALVRWEHPLLGTVSPDEFIHLAEEDGLIVPLQRWVLEVATRQAAVLMADGWDVQMGVNVSVRHLQAGCLAPDVAAALAAAHLPPGKLMLELTESVLLDAEGGLVSDLETLRGMGVVLSLDDFGRGWSSLAYLARLPVQVLKMDREFVAGIETGPRGRALVASVVELGRTLGMDVVAEGVETEEQVAELRAMDCRYLQGYLFGRPMPFADLRALLDTFDPTVLDGGAADLDSGVHMVRPGS
ncbi:putative bifunctional diguanylate cyclase/phosphodiesterase [Blastococcus saxobsidens]|uniref:Diguanylate cyclase/phosphodiesterase with PAS/PAC sensor(S) n=1 Tax=Blastococcus saxobsidens (strain DD2) TaxID=1146883 RepID=H6RX72_BLASD|nr:EAL domain-containing protein [Blastococcus saxobsidens]CCG04683.1 Diguanylate cyclase/phosphodiesterase with PAS/PAC sensor(S) [Blastococcus saxobsidens DD2]